MTEEGQSGLDKSWIPFGGGARKCMGYNFAIMEIKVSNPDPFSYRVPAMRHFQLDTLYHVHWIKTDYVVCNQSASDPGKHLWALFLAILQAIVPLHRGCNSESAICCMSNLSRAQGAPEAHSQSGCMCLCKYDLQVQLYADMIMRMT